jgi:hypothetical protein
MRVDLGLEQDSGRRFALWSILHMLGAAPDLDVAFEEPADRDAARNFMELMERAQADAPAESAPSAPAHGADGAPRLSWPFGGPGGGVFHVPFRTGF